jgi:hypothetical protein
MGLARNSGRHAVEAAGNGPVFVELATVFGIKHRTADSDACGVCHDLAGITVLRSPVQLAFDARGRPVRIAGGVYDCRMPGTKGNGLVEFLIEIQGFNQGKVKYGMAAIAATQRAHDAVRVQGAYLIKELVRLGAQECIPRKDRIQA